jgi:hypothetical protein
VNSPWKTGICRGSFHAMPPSAEPIGRILRTLRATVAVTRQGAAVSPYPSVRVLCLEGGQQVGMADHRGVLRRPGRPVGPPDTPVVEQHTLGESSEGCEVAGAGCPSATAASPLTGPPARR